MRRNIYITLTAALLVCLVAGSVAAQSGYLTGRGLKVGPTTRTTRFQIDSKGAVTGTYNGGVNDPFFFLNAPASTGGVGISLNMTAKTIGDAVNITLDDDALTTGLYLTCYGGSTHDYPVFTVGKGGAVTIAPFLAGADTDSLYINGTPKTTGDAIQVKFVDATLNGGKYLNFLGGAGAAEVYSVAEDGATAITSAVATTNSLSITNNVSTAGDLITLTADDDTLDADSFYLRLLGGTDHATEVLTVGEGGQTVITPSAAAITADAISIAGNALTTGDFLSLTADDDILNGGKYLNFIGGASADTAVFTVGEQGVIADAGVFTSQTTENAQAGISLTTDSTYLTGTDITYSGARGSSALKLTGTYSGVDGAYSNIYSNITTTGAHTAAGAGVIGIKGVVTNTAAMTDGNIYGAQFIAKHNHATNDLPAQVALVGVEGWAYDSGAGYAATVLGANVGYHNEGTDTKPGGSVFRGLQVFTDDAAGADAADEATSICLWNMAGTQTDGIKFVKSDGGWTTDITLQNAETITNATNGYIGLGGSVNFAGVGTDTSAAGGLLGGAGVASSSTTVTTAAAAKFLSFYGSTTATSGDSVMQYNRIYDKAASASTGTMIANRAFATATTAYSGNVHGTVSTASLSGGSTDFTGVMSGVKAVCDLGTTTAALGSAYAMVVETQSSVNSQNATKFGYFNVRSLKSGGGGEGTLPSLFMNIGDTGAEVDAGTATSNMVKTDLGDAATAAGLKVMINGTTYWIQLAAYTP